MTHEEKETAQTLLNELFDIFNKAETRVEVCDEDKKQLDAYRKSGAEPHEFSSRAYYRDEVKRLQNEVSTATDVLLESRSYIKALVQAIKSKRNRLVCELCTEITSLSTYCNACNYDNNYPHWKFNKEMFDKPKEEGKNEGV